MRNVIDYSDTLKLPIDVATQALAFIARRGGGKTYAAGKLVEELLLADVQVIVLDTVGNWYGLRIGRDGKSAGFDIPVLGGLRGDIPLEASGGALIADIAVETGRSMILDASQFSLADRRRFAVSFGERLWRRKKGEADPAPLHLVIEESQLIVPQFTGAGGGGDIARMLGTYEEIIRLGRNYGIGVSMISQRPQSINKEVLNQTECLFVGQINGSQERDALKKWITHQGMDPNLVNELPSLPVGTFYVWSPQWLGILKKVRVGTKKTFDSTATPKVGQSNARRELKPLDLADLQERMTATIERAKADDPKELHRKITELQRQLTAKPVAPSNDADLSRARAEGKRESDAAWKGVNASLDAAMREDRSRFDRLRRLLGKVAPMFSDIAKELSVEPTTIPEMPKEMPRAPIARRIESPVIRAPRTAIVKTNDGTAGGIPRAQQKILDTLAMLESVGITQPSKTQLALWCGVSPTSGAYFNNLGALRSAGLISYPSSGDAALTDDGRSQANAVTPLTAEEMQASLLAKVGAAKAAIVRFLIGIYPESIAKEELAERIGVSPTSGAYFNNLGALRTLGVIDYPSVGRAVAKPVLFLEG